MSGFEYVPPEKRLMLKMNELKNVSLMLDSNEIKLIALQSDIAHLKSRKQHLEWETRDMKQRGVEL